MDDQVLFDLEDFSEEDLIKNPTTRTPVCLCLDVSSSMRIVSYKDVKDNPRAKQIYLDAKAYGHKVSRDGKETVAYSSKELVPFMPISRLKEAVQHFFRLLMDDDNVRDSVEVGIVTFADDPVVVRKIARLRDGDENLIELETGNQTAMGEGLIKTLNQLEDRKDHYKETGVAYYQPLLVLISDGFPNGSARLLQDAIERIHQQVSARKLSIFAIYVGNEKDKPKALPYLKLIAGADHVFEMGSVNMMAFFEHLSQSVSKQAMSTPGENASYYDDPALAKSALEEMLKGAINEKDFTKNGKILNHR